MGVFLQDLRFAIRSLRKAPAFPLAAIATLALGIGATTAIFSTLNAVLLKPLPYPRGEDLYAIRTALTDGRVTTGLVSYGELSRLNNRPELSIAHAAGMQAIDFTLLRDDGVAQKARVYGVTEGFFDVFGLSMTKGGFAPEDFVPRTPPPPGPPPPGAAPPPPPNPPRIVISYPLWRNLYNSDPNIVGKPITFAEFRTTIAGVAPLGFDTPHGGDFWLNTPLGPDDINHGLEGFMRLKPGANYDRAKAEMATIIAQLDRDFPQADHNRVYVTRSLVEQVVGDLGPILIIVMSATGLLLLLACVNVTNLLLARGAARAREMAVRVALGAGRGRLIRQLLTESVFLATCGAIVGLLIGYLGLKALLLLGASKLPRLDVVTFDTRVFLFTLVTLVVTGLLVGFAPAIRLARSDVRTLMNETTRSTTGGRGTARWLSVMTVVEIALAILLVAGAGWLVRGFANLRSTNPGFVADKRLIFDVTYRGPKYPNGEAVIAAQHDLNDKIKALQGVISVGATSSFPLRGTLESSLLLQLHGEAMDTKHPMGTRQRTVSEGYFDAAGTKVIQGRNFGPDDRADSERVAIINKVFATRYLAGRDPIGVKFSAGYPTPDPTQEVMVVGIIEDVRQKELATEAEPAYYLPSSQNGQRRQTVVVSTSLADATPLEAAIRDVVQKFDKNIAVDFELANDIVSGTIRRQQLGMTLMLIFGGVAVLLAAIGIYGVVAYAVSQRRDEMATRLALGASPGSVFWLVMRQGGLLAILGTTIGLVAAYFSGQIVASQIYAIRASDPVMLSSAIAVVAGIAVVATLLPAARASKLNPARVLHPE